MQIPTTFQTAGPFRLGGGEIVVIFVIIGAVWLISRSAKAFGEGIGRGIAKGQQDAMRREGPPTPDKQSQTNSVSGRLQ